MAWNFLTFNLFECIYFKSVSCQQHIVGIFLKNSYNLFLLLGVFRPFILKVTIDTFRLLSTIFGNFTICYTYYLFLFPCFSAFSGFNYFIWFHFIFFLSISIILLFKFSLVIALEFVIYIFLTNLSSPLNNTKLLHM